MAVRARPARRPARLRRWAAWSWGSRSWRATTGCCSACPSRSRSCASCVRRPRGSAHRLAAGDRCALLGFVRRRGALAAAPARRLRVDLAVRRERSHPLDHRVPRSSTASARDDARVVPGARALGAARVAAGSAGCAFALIALRLAAAALRPRAVRCSSGPGGRRRDSVVRRPGSSMRSPSSRSRRSFGRPRPVRHVPPLGGRARAARLPPRAHRHRRPWFAGSRRRRPAWDAPRATRMFTAMLVAVVLVVSAVGTLADRARLARRTRQSGRAARRPGSRSPPGDVVDEPGRRAPTATTAAGEASSRRRTRCRSSRSACDATASAGWRSSASTSSVALSPVLTGEVRPDWLSDPLVVTAPADRRLATPAPTRQTTPGAALYAVCLSPADASVRPMTRNVRRHAAGRASLVDHRGWLVPAGSRRRGCSARRRDACPSRPPRAAPTTSAWPAPRRRRGPRDRRAVELRHAALVPRSRRSSSGCR